MKLSSIDKQLIEGTIQAIKLELEFGEKPSYFDSDNPDYDNDDKDWEIAPFESRNGVKVCKLLTDILNNSEEKQ